MAKQPDSDPNVSTNAQPDSEVIAATAGSSEPKPGTSAGAGAAGGNASKHIAPAACGLLAVAAVLTWSSGRMEWITAQAYDDKTGALSPGIVGGSWASEISVLALLLVAAAVAGLALKRVGRRIVGVITALAAAGAAYSPLQLLASDPSTERAHSILTTSPATGHINDTAALNPWAEITHLEVHAPAVLLGLLGCAVALVAAVLLVMRPGPARKSSTQYERTAQRTARIETDLAEDPDSERLIWDALDADLDPTDRPRSQ